MTNTISIVDKDKSSRWYFKTIQYEDIHVEAFSISFGQMQCNIQAHHQTSSEHHIGSLEFSILG